MHLFTFGVPRNKQPQRSNKLADCGLVAWYREHHHWSTREQGVPTSHMPRCRARFRKTMSQRSQPQGARQRLRDTYTMCGKKEHCSRNRSNPPPGLYRESSATCSPALCTYLHHHQRNIRADEAVCKMANTRTGSTYVCACVMSVHVCRGLEQNRPGVTFSDPKSHWRRCRRVGALNRDRIAPPR